ncbi:unnamed protein product [Cylicocyclus nassatus]|uniref:Uncharacterized protein n=1 Tax=Cylicocyclus nassatus TaxID=53992 RepID=A0AA36H8Y4_CYLNA|nr:unnamed protein product [Cylicocyclus nassatus]
MLEEEKLQREDRKRRELLEQGYEQYRHINFNRGRNTVPVDLFFNVNPEIRLEQFKPKPESHAPFAIARGYKTLHGNDVKILRLTDETTSEPGSGELPQKVILVDEVSDQHFQDDLEIINDIDPDLQPNPAETYPKEIPRIPDEMQQGASWLQMPSINSVDSLIEQREEKEKGGRKTSEIPLLVYETTPSPVNIETSENITLSSVLNLTTNSTATNMFTVRPEFATPLLSVISDLVRDEYDWEDKGEWRSGKSPASKKRSSGILGWRGVFRKHKRMGVQQHQEFPRGDMLNEKKFAVLNPVREKEQPLTQNSR